jgi:hypothetical protein
MKVKDLDFYEFDPDEDNGLVPDSKESCMRIIRATAHAMSEGQIPGDCEMRFGLLFAVIAKLAIECGRAVHAAKKEAPREGHEKIEVLANHSMAMFVAAAVSWAEAVDQNANQVAAFGDD